MKRAPLIFTLLGILLGWAATTYFQTPPKVLQVQSGIIFQCPMHPLVNSDHAGQCTICGMDLVARQKTAATTTNPIVMLPSGSPNVIGVETVAVKTQPLVRTLRVVGVIGENESRHAVVSAPVEGRIDALTMSCEGDRLARRQPFGNIFSRTLLAAAADFKSALAAGDPVKLAAAKHRLEQSGLAAEQIDSIPQRSPDDLYFGILAPFSGTIVKSYVSEGQYVKEGERLFELADLTTMWFTFPVSETDLPFVKLEQIVDITTASLPGRTVRARITFISPSLDPQTHTAALRVLLEHPELHLKNKSVAEGVLELEAPEVLAVPRSAVLWPGNKPRVYVEKSSGSYEPRAVKLGRTGDTLVEVLDGLAEGERVVVSGNMLIDGQAQLEQALP
jgi:Cu(I)/Ag(I) efflux system membrane fusion protein